ncbi:MAG TPA: DUF167 family protein [Alphaproteobacteria bacterium]|jgi:hypothetical protein|nr:DUF167 family protein [Alphaproteobacteria bacterium]
MAHVLTTKEDNKVTLMLKVTPKAARDRILGWVKQPNNLSLLKIAVRANPEKGQANLAVQRLLSKRLAISLSLIRLEYGMKDQYKRITIIIDPLRLDQLLEQAIREDNT